ncbi:MAG: NAD(P)-dependent oxidoreductase [Alphaproteobacteria bacterium]|nr:NAD(P)-dependent oxidoreductase [Alphaproteobacteria bacterium]
MSSKMLKFVTTDKKMPDKRGAEMRVQDFDEIYDEFDVTAAEDQAGRCSQCGVPFCQINCPLHNNIPDWLMLTAEGRMEEAYRMAAQTNNMPEICGRICPQDRLCEGSCVIEKGFESVTIGAVEKHITETAFENGWVQPPQPVAELSESVGIIGAGPAGLAAADMLRQRGYQVTVYDRYDRVGGLLIYGIPGFKLEKHVVQRRHDLLADGGVTFRMNVDIGVDISFEEIRASHDAVLVATGVYKARDINAPGVGMEGIVPALDYLTASNRKSLGDAVPDFDSGTLDAKGRDVVVIGGGDTAMDCVRTAIRQEANSVTCLYRRDRANMPGSQREVANAEEEGVIFKWLSAPQAFLGDNHVRAVQAQKIHLGQPDATGRQVPQIIEDSSHDIPADLVIKALGFDPEDLPAMFGAPELAVSKWGTIDIDWRSMMTNLPGVFAAGDIVRGASLVVWGVRDGRDAAAAIDSYIMAQSDAPQAAAGA